MTMNRRTFLGSAAALGLAPSLRAFGANEKIVVGVMGVSRAYGAPTKPGHAPAAILGCSAGKHVYVEKPCCQNAREGELLVEAARKHKRVVQHGTQRRSWPAMREAVDALRQGAIGRVTHAQCFYLFSDRPS